MPSNYKCGLCGAEHSFGSRFQALDGGWTMIEIHTPHGNHYGVYCDDHTTADIAKHVVAKIAEKK